MNARKQRSRVPWTHYNLKPIDVTVILSYFLSYLLTYLLHGAESFLRS